MRVNPDKSTHHSPNQGIFKKTLLSAISEGSSILLFIFGVLVARGLGPAGYGEFTYALAYCALFALIAEAGLGELLTRELSYNKEHGKKVLRCGLGLQIILIPVISILLGTSLIIIEPSTASSLVIMTMLIAVVSRVVKTALRGVLRGSGRFEIEATTMAAERLALVILGIVSFVSQWNIQQVVTAFAVLKLLDVSLLTLYVNNKIARLSPTFGFKNLQWMIKELLPFSLTMAIWVLYNYTDTIMLGYFKGAQQVGEYGAIYQLFEGMIVIPSILGAVFLPWMSYEFKKGFIGVERALQQGARLLIASSVPVVCVSLLASTELLHLIFGTEYVGAALGLSMLLGSAPFVFLFWFLRQGLIAIKKVKTLLIISSIGVIFNIIGNLIVIPPYGLYGACATTLATEFLTFIAALYVLHLNGIRGPGLMPWIQSISAGVAIVGPMIIIEYILGWAILGLPIGLVLAHLALCRTKFWTDNERKRLRTLHLAW